MRRSCRSAGFTFVELLTVLALGLVVALLGFPSLQKMIVRSKLRGATEQLSALMRQARLEAVKNNATVVLKLHGTLADAEGPARSAYLFVDRNDNGIYDPPVGAIDNDGPRLPGGFTLPPDQVTPHVVVFAGTGAYLEGNANAFVGFDENGDGESAWVRFLPNGSVAKSGAVRIRDGNGNILEVRVDPPSTARVQIRKFEADPASYNPDAPDGVDAPDSYFEAGGVPAFSGDGDHEWNWRY
jgi:type II secretory pathway pseudopilin PulG